MYMKASYSFQTIVCHLCNLPAANLQSAFRVNRINPSLADQSQNFEEFSTLAEQQVINKDFYITVTVYSYQTQRILHVCVLGCVQGYQILIRAPNDYKDA